MLENTLYNLKKCAHIMLRKHDVLSNQIRICS